MKQKVVVIVWHHLVVVSSDDGRMFLSQHLISSSTIDRPRCPFSTQCVGHEKMMRSAVCSCTPHSKIQEGARLHLCMSDHKCPTPVCKRLSLTQAGLGRPSLRGLEPTRGMKLESLDELFKNSMFHVKPFHRRSRTSSSDASSNSSVRQVQMGVWVLISLAAHPMV